MASSEANLLGKRKPEDNWKAKSILKKHKDKETADSLQQLIKRVELLEKKFDHAYSIPVKV